MISRFECRAAQRRTGVPPAAGRDNSMPPELRVLLQSLLGRVITVTCGGREVRGKLIRDHPPTLTGPEGQVTVLSPDQVTSVQF